LIAIRQMAASELGRIAEIDRSEHVTEEYALRGGCLERRSVDVVVPPWSRCGDGEHSVPGRVAAWQPLLERGGTLLGAFDGGTASSDVRAPSAPCASASPVGRLAGIAIYRPRLAEGTANLAVLHVSRGHRRSGVGSLLTREVARLARAGGARRLYVSATPSGSAVGFYRRLGFEPTDEPDAALFALEPDDIHMILDL
jgi:ribosomal protein S18 acetylase RimI-like enzyme